MGCFRRLRRRRRRRSVVDRSSIGFGIGIGVGRRLEAVGASSSSFVVLPVAEVAATLLPIRQQ